MHTHTCVYVQLHIPVHIYMYISYNGFISLRIFNQRPIPGHRRTYFEKQRFSSIRLEAGNHNLWNISALTRSPTQHHPCFTQLYSLPPKATRPHFVRGPPDGIHLAFGTEAAPLAPHHAATPLCSVLTSMSCGKDIGCLLICCWDFNSLGVSIVMQILVSPALTFRRVSEISSAIQTASPNLGCPVRPLTLQKRFRYGPHVTKYRCPQYAGRLLQLWMLYELLSMQGPTKMSTPLLRTHTWKEEYPKQRPKTCQRTAQKAVVVHTSGVQPDTLYPQVGHPLKGSLKGDIGQ